MFIRFAHSPSFEEGWAVGVQIEVAKFGEQVSNSAGEGFVYTKHLRADAYVRANELEDKVPATLTPDVMETSDLKSIQKIAASVAFIPAEYPWVTMDGALSSLQIIAGDTSMTAEWNSGFPEGWQGVESLQSELRRLYVKYQ